MSAGTTGGLQRVFLVAEGLDPKRDREAAWQLVETVGVEMIFCGAAAKPAVGRFFHSEQPHRISRRGKR